MKNDLGYQDFNLDCDMFSTSVLYLIVVQAVRSSESISIEVRCSDLVSEVLSGHIILIYDKFV